MPTALDISITEMESQEWMGNNTSLTYIEVATVVPKHFPYFYTLSTYLKHRGIRREYFDEYKEYRDLTRFRKRDAFLINKAIQRNLEIEDEEGFRDVNISFVWSTSELGTDYWEGVFSDFYTLAQELKRKGELK